jgi:hypothetical protein
MQASLRVHAAQWRVIWDPSVAVDHFPSQRFDEDDRAAPTLRAAANMLHNQTYILLSLLPKWRMLVACLYPLVIGTRYAPGLLMLPATLWTSQSAGRTLFYFRANLQGRSRGLRTYLRTRGQPQFPPELAQQCPSQAARSAHAR